MSNQIKNTVLAHKIANHFDYLGWTVVSGELTVQPDLAIEALILEVLDRGWKPIRDVQTGQLMDTRGFTMREFPELAHDLACNIADALVERHMIDLSDVAEQYPGALRVNNPLAAIRTAIIDQVAVIIENGDPFAVDLFPAPDDLS